MYFYVVKLVSKKLITRLVFNLKIFYSHIIFIEKKKTLKAIENVKYQ